MARRKISSITEPSQKQGNIQNPSIVAADDPFEFEVNVNRNNSILYPRENKTNRLTIHPINNVLTLEMSSVYVPEADKEIIIL
jgi:hypothetical protein